MAGNHEHAVADRLDLGWFNRYARAAAEWTRERLDTAHREWLGALPLVREIGDATLVHASPAQPDEWDYLVTAEDGFAAFSHFATRWCFVGHSHVPGAVVARLVRARPRARRGLRAKRAGPSLHRQRRQRRSAARPRSAGDLGAVGRGGRAGRPAPRRLRRRRRPPEDRRGRAAAVPGRSAGGGRLSLVRESLGRAALLVGSAWTLALAFPVTDWGLGGVDRPDAAAGRRARHDAARRLRLGLALRHGLLSHPAALAHVDVPGLQRDPVAADVGAHPAAGRVLRALRRARQRAGGVAGAASLRRLGAGDRAVSVGRRRVGPRSPHGRLPVGHAGLLAVSAPAGDPGGRARRRARGLARRSSR